MSFLGIDVGNIIGSVTNGAVEAFGSRNDLLIAQLNLQAAQATTAAQTAAANSTSDQNRLLITAFLVLVGGVVTVRVLRRS